VSFSCLTDKCWPNTLPDSLAALRHMPCVGEVYQLMAGAKQTGLIVTMFR